MNKSDSEIWTNFKQGDLSSFEFIYERYHEIMISYGYKLCNNKDIVKDAIHNLFVELWRRRDRLSDVDNLKLYLFMGLKREIIKTLKKEKKISRHFVSGNPNDFYITISYEDELVGRQQEDDNKKQLSHHLNQL